MASNFSFACTQMDLSPSFLNELREAWTEVRRHTGLSDELLAILHFEHGHASPDSIDSERTKQSWWQLQLNELSEATFRLHVPDRLRALQRLSAAHYAADVSSLVSSEDGPMRVGLHPDLLAMRKCPGCSATMDAFGDHTLCCLSLGTYARHNEIRNEFGDICLDLNLHVETEVGRGCSGTRRSTVGRRFCCGAHSAVVRKIGGCASGQIGLAN